MNIQERLQTFLEHKPLMMQLVKGKAKGTKIQEWLHTFLENQPFKDVVIERERA